MKRFIKTWWVVGLFLLIAVGLNTAKVISDKPTLITQQMTPEEKFEIDNTNWEWDIYEGLGTVILFSLGLIAKEFQSGSDKINRAHPRLKVVIEAGINKFFPNMDFARGNVMIISRCRLKIICVHGDMLRPEKSLTWSKGEGVVGFTWKDATSPNATDDPFIVKDLELIDIGQFNIPLDKYHRTKHVQWIISVPMYSDKRFIGVLNFDGTKQVDPQFWQANEEEILKKCRGYADNTASTLEDFGIV